MDLSDFEFLQEIQLRLGSKLKVKELEPKLADLLKVIELKYKIKDESEKEKLFWDLVDGLVNEEMEKGLVGNERAESDEDTDSSSSPDSYRGSSE